VSRPGDAAEREAHRAADVVAHGGSVTSWSFSALPVGDPVSVQRDEAPKEKAEDEKYLESLKTTGEAVLATKEGKAVKERILSDPVVKAMTDAASSTPGKIAAGTAVVGGVTALAATGKSLPVQPPEMRLDRITPGLSAKVTYQGPVNAPTFVGLTVTYKEQLPETKRAPGVDPIAADISRLKAQQEMFRPVGEKAAAKAEEDRMVAAWVASRKLPGAPPGFTIPLMPPPTRQQDESVQQAAESESADPPAQAFVGDALASPGRPLDAATRRSMEARFGNDFAGVRIHDDATASATAAHTEASAFTVGQHIVFGTGRYEPTTPAGRHLLAHELAHVVQQSRGTDGGGPVVQRRSVFASLGILLGIAEGTWEDRELHDYLDAISRSNQIEGSYDSDNKARAIVRRWRAASPGFDLLGAQKILLIREMLDGPTLGDDEEAILHVLEQSDASDLRAILAPDGISLSNLERDINGDNRTRLDSFINSRFVGGRAAVLAGRVEVTGNVIPAGSPSFRFDPATLDARFDSDRTVDELIALIASLSAADRTRALHHLVTVRRPRQLRAVEQLVEMGSEATDPARKAAIERVAERRRTEELKTEQVLLHFYRAAVPATEADLRSGTSPSGPARAADLRAALRPRQPSSAGFRATLSGEVLTYEQKVRARLPILVDRYYTDLVPGRGRSEHDNQANVHDLAEFEAIGNVSKAETDAVFGRFYSAPDHPALVADRPRIAGRPAVAGNLHDRFAVFERDFRRMTPDDRREWAKFRLFYFFQTDRWMRRLNERHGASPQFDTDNQPTNDVARTLEALATEFTAVADNVRRLNAITRNWRAGARGSQILVQVFRERTPEKDRLLLWQMFQIFVHEYLHTLVHAEYRDYAESFGPRSLEYNTLIEGVDSLLTEIVWTSIAPRVREPALRRAIEGPQYAALPAIDVPHVSRTGRYASYTEALGIVDLVGIEALYAAYFLGLIDRIGAPPSATRGRP
jgi:hypothetical protein